MTKGKRDLVEIIVRGYNQRLVRVIRGILSDENESEEVMQEAYVRAYANLHQFEGRSKFSTLAYKVCRLRSVCPSQKLELSKENVKVRLFHARAAMRHQLFEYVGTASPKAFQFLGARCDRLVQVVQERIKVR